MPDSKIAKIKRGRMKRINGMPADLMAINSKLSPKFPNVIIEEKSNAKGIAVVSMLMDTRPTNFKIMKVSNPFPTKSSMYSQKNCMVSTNIEIVNAAKKGPINALRISMSNFLNKIVVLATYSIK